MSYMVFYTENGVSSDITSLVSDIQYGGDVKTAVRKLELSYAYGTDTYTPRLELKNGNLLTLRSDDKELVRAVIFSSSKSHNGDSKVTAYTHGVYLTKNKETYLFRNMTASQIAARICCDFGIPAGNIVDTQVIHPKFILREKTLWDILIIALTETSKKTGVDYRVFFREGKLCIKEKRQEYVVWALEEGVNLISSNYSISIENMKNQIKVTGKLPAESKQKYNPEADTDWDAPRVQPSSGEKELIHVVKNEEMQQLYGILQEIKEESGDQVTQSSLIQTANQMLEELAKEEVEADIEALGIGDVEAGMAVYVIETTTGMIGSYYVEQDDHTISGNHHTMKLKLKLTDEVPRLEYEPLQEEAQEKPKYDPEKDTNW